MPNSSDQVEDIFAATGTPDSIPAPLAWTPTEITTTPRRSYRRLGLIIAICLIVLLLLGGSGFGVWLWLQRPPENTNVNTTIVNDAVIIVPENTNTNVNTMPTFVDVDHDGLSDDEELVENTNPKKKDTDEDGLSDREEVRVYDTDPRNPDTDGDGYTDGDEVTHFYHPNSPDPKQRLFDLPQ